MKIANRRVNQASEIARSTGMGTTLTVAVVEGARVTFANVGDSRIYTMRDGNLRQLSRDDSGLLPSL